LVQGFATLEWAEIAWQPTIMRWTACDLAGGEEVVAVVACDLGLVDDRAAVVLHEAAERGAPALHDVRFLRERIEPATVHLHVEVGLGVDDDMVVARGGLGSFGPADRRRDPRG
jgi:hypothetical protein